MKIIRKSILIRRLPILLIFSLLISCNAISHKEHPVRLWTREWPETCYKETLKCIDKQRNRNYVICLQYVWDHYEYNQQLDFVWSIPEVNDNKIKLDIFYRPDIKKNSKIKKFEDDYIYHGSLAWLRDIGYDKMLRDKLNFYVLTSHAIFNTAETDLWYKDMQRLSLPSIEDVEHFRTDTISNDFIKGYCELMKGLMIPVMRKYSEELKIPRPDFSNYYRHLDSIQ